MFRCLECQKEYPQDGLEYLCDCGGLLTRIVDSRDTTGSEVSIGEMLTPVLDTKIDDLTVTLKVDYLMPTGSFKDRGAKTLISRIKELGISEIVEDSSGNAGASIAAYAAACNITCHIYVPENTPEGKITQINSYGANIVKVPGNREETSTAVKQAASHIYYASHVYNPLFFEGVKSFARELAFQLGSIDYLMVPVGNGTLLLGAYLGFLEMKDLPKLIAVQSESCAPIYQDFHGKERQIPEPTIAKGIQVGDPMRKKEILEALEKSCGDVITVSEAEVIYAKESLSERGLFVESTAAVSLAGALKYFQGSASDHDRIVVPLTGTGLKELTN